MKKKAIIIGGGLSGLTTATLLAERGAEVIVLEKNIHLGGRASNVTDKETQDPVPIGPHVYLGNYKHFLNFLKKIGAEEKIVWDENSLIEIVYKKRHHRFSIPKLPIPGWLFVGLKFAKYPFLSFWDKVSLVPFGLSVFVSSWGHLEKIDRISAYDYLKSKRVSENAINKLWRFFVLSMLNVPLEKCSAAELALLVKAWYGFNNVKVGFPASGLGDLYTVKSQEYIVGKGGSIHNSSFVKKINFGEDKKIESILAIVDGREKILIADLYISSLNPIELKGIIPQEILGNKFFRHLNYFKSVPYIAVNLWFDRKVSQKQFWVLLNDSDPPEHINLDYYDFSNIYPNHDSKSFISSNIVYSSQYDSMTDSEVIERTLSGLKEAFPKMDARVVHSSVNRIKHAIYAPLIGMRQHKLTNKTPYKNFYLTGDWTNKKMTQNMESAVWSGHQCVEEIFKDWH